MCGVVVIAATSTARASDSESGFTVKQFNTALVKAGIACSGWRVTVLLNLAGNLRVEWKSGGLPYDFSVSSPGELEIDDLGEEQVVEFSGCAPHDCGGVDGVSGMLLYASRVKQGFFAHYRSDSSKGFGSFGSLDFSDNAEEPAHSRYKVALEKAMQSKLSP